MRTTILMSIALAGLGLAACSRSDTSPRPAHSTVAADMPDAAAVPGAQVVNPPPAGQGASAASAGQPGAAGAAGAHSAPTPGTPLTNHP
jgi:hypothetical protein